MPKMQIVYRDIDELVAYDNNPRLNDVAVPALKQSILDFGFRVPVIVDKDDVIVAGHTRVLAVKALIEDRPDLEADLRDIPVLVAEDLTEEQVKAFRLVDNKVGEIATWDFDMLAVEVAGLTEVGIDLQGYGWTQEELDCLTNVVSVDCLSETEAQTLAGQGGDGINTPLFKGRGLDFTVDGSGVRISWGSLAFMVNREDFDPWNDELMKKHNYNPEAVIDDIAERLGLLEAKQKRAVSVGHLDTKKDVEESDEQQQATA